MKRLIQNHGLILFLFTFLGTALITHATDYHVGPMQPLSSIGEVPWAELNAGDRVYIYWRETPYQEKWVINRKGTADELIQVIGVSGPEGQQPIIDGNGATTVPGVDFWNESRGIIKIGGSSVPTDDLPEYIIIENLEIKSGRPGYYFTNDHGETEEYSSNAAAIYIEKGANITLRNCTLHDAGNGLFIGAYDGLTKTILVEKNYIYDNGIVGSQYEHNAYTAAIDIVFQYNRFGPPRAGAYGNNLKDRSAGTVVRYNWIEDGSRLMDLVDAEDSEVLVDHPTYSATYVYGHILVKSSVPGNSQVIHYGGDSGTYPDYRKGNLYFYNNTVISTRDGNTTLINLSSNDETAHVFNNVIYSTLPGNYFAMINNNGTFNLHHNWIKPNWKECHCTPDGTVNDMGDNIEEEDPLFVDYDGADYRPQNTSGLVDNGDALPEFLVADHNVNLEYVEHLNAMTRAAHGNIDIGAFENTFGLGVEETIKETAFAIFPNPVQDKLVVNDPNGEIKSVSVYNSLGQLVLSSNSNELNVSALNRGVYLISIHTVNNVIRSQKLIKQ